MSTLKERIESDLKEAMKASDTLRVSTLRLIKSAIKNKEIDKGGSLGDDEVIQVLSSLVKQRRESVEMYQKAGRKDLAEKEEAEIKIIQSYMPEQLSDEEIREIIAEAIKQTGATSMKDMGKVMKTVMAKVKGRADGKKVNEMVRQALSA
ncbi:MAG: GatB/YqeY domain-containing protein [Nitrospirae bacterium]|nr:MAG: GatB/YqeY domain-containing protein [Nitrospirota bacterium]